MLKTEIVNTQLSLRAANYEKNKDDIDKLTSLYKAAVMKESNAQAQMQAQQMQQQQQQIGQQMEGEANQLATATNELNNQPADTGMESGQAGLTGWDGRSYNQQQSATPGAEL
jgi:hypothetical protein